jgi:hypothetical protein
MSNHSSSTQPTQFSDRFHALPIRPLAMASRCGLGLIEQAGLAPIPIRVFVELVVVIVT